jgi:hypothetical protein
MEHIKKINPWKTALFIGIFEFFALLILPALVILNLNTVLTGLICGFAGALLAIAVFNHWLSRYLHLDMILGNSRVELRKLDLIIPALASGVFLAVLFLVQNYLVFEFRSIVINDLLTGFFATFFAVMICVFIYNLLTEFTKIRLGGELSDGSFKVRSAGILRTSFFVALFELFILPLLSLFYILFQNLPFYLQYPFAGLVAGFIGSFIAASIYNPLAEPLKGISLKLEK